MKEKELRENISKVLRLSSELGIGIVEVVVSSYYLDTFELPPKRILGVWTAPPYHPDPWRTNWRKELIVDLRKKYDQITTPEEVR